MEKFLSKIKFELKSFLPFRKLNPLIYWNNLLRIFSVVIILLIIFSFYILYQIKHQQIFQITPVPTEESNLIKEKLLNQVNEIFENKKTRAKEIQSELKVYKDPSIN